ncbi:sulfotransferase family 2 domain-containing protein [Paraburkholderia strydomiana]|jgi:hypothetical protein|uniref:Sulfotransferase family 2 domain-containing protein n=1 Tax=Paraburkholderia strydomiana TaxID=1245417 RepID=A0ABW9EBC3_9BURK
MTVDTATISAFYERYLGRGPDAAGLAHFAQFDSVLDVERAIAHSDEAVRNDRLSRIPTMPVAWKICILEEAKLIFVPIAKNAHTSILTALLRMHGIDWRDLPVPDALDAQYGTDDDKIHSVLVGHNTGLLLKDRSPAFVEDVLQDPSYLRVTVFRDPLQRVVSACNHFFVQELDNPMAQRHSRQVVGAFAPARPEQYEQNPGEFWLRRLMKYLMANRSPVDAHWMPQTDYIKSLRIDHVLPIERLDLLERIVEARSGQRLDIRALNVRGDQPAGVSRGKPASARPPLADDVRTAVEEFYWLDRHFYEAAKANVGAIERQFQR